VDLGAESGRVHLGAFDGERFDVHEVHRFPNTPVQLPDGLHWNLLRIYSDMLEGVRKAAREDDAGFDGIGIDSWAVDYGLLDASGALLGEPYHYRDARTEGMVELAESLVPREEIYRTTGIQFMPINTMPQLLSERGSVRQTAAETFLMIPDLLNYWLTGRKVCERTNATSTQLYDLGAETWGRGLMERLGIPTHLFPDIVPPGEQLGPVCGPAAESLGFGSSLPVIAVASHDTASAVVAVPAWDDDFAYISSGTWSLVGLELPAPVLTPEAMEANFTNEGGFGGTVRFLKNVMGLWLLQECRRTWAAASRSYSYDELAAAAEVSPAFGALVDPDDPAFLSPGDMPARITVYCRDTGRRPPEGVGEVVRCVFDSLALKYRWVLERAEQLSGRRASVVHVVGGGSQNALLCRLTASATRRPVLAGPAEAAALGNLLVQAQSGGRIAGLDEMRAVSRRSTDLVRYEPEGTDDEWEQAYARFTEVLAVANGVRGG